MLASVPDDRLICHRSLFVHNLLRIVRKETTVPYDEGDESISIDQVPPDYQEYRSGGGGEHI